MNRAALLVDLDGTLADSLPVMRAVFGAFLARFGIEATDAEFDSLNGPPLETVVARLRDSHCLPGSVSELTAAYMSLVQQHYAGVMPNAGAGALLKGAAAKGWVVAVVTSNARTIAAGWLDRTDLARHVGVLVAEEDAGRGKPFPDPYLTALARSGCCAGLSAAIEDSPGGVTAALAAGVATFVYRPNGAPWLGPGPVTPVRSLAEVLDLIGS